MVSFAFADNLFLLVLNDTAKIHNKIKINVVNVTVLLMFFIVFPHCLFADFTKLQLRLSYLIQMAKNEFHCMV